MSETADAKEADSDIQLVQPFLQLLKTLSGYQRQCSRSEQSQRLFQEIIQLANGAMNLESIFDVSEL